MKGKGNYPSCFSFFSFLSLFSVFHFFYFFFLFFCFLYLFISISFYFIFILKKLFETLLNVDWCLLSLSILTLTNSSETAAASSSTSIIAILWKNRTRQISSVTALWSQETPESNSEGWTRRLTRVASCSTSGSIPPSWRSPLMQGMMKRPPTRHLLRVMVRWHTTADR